MPKKKEPPEPRVQAIAETGLGMELLPGGFAIARRFEVRAEWGHFVASGPYAATITVEVVDARARSVEVAVRTPQPSGVTSTMMMRVRIREVVASGALQLLQRVEAFDEKSFKLLSVDKGDSEASEAIRRLVGWVPKKGARP